MKDKKFIIVMRHGERTDFSGFTPKFGEWDPELTKRGEEQAFKAGNIISKQLQEMNLNSDSTFIQVISSPFVRTIQTARNVIKGIKNANEVKGRIYIYRPYGLLRHEGQFFGINRCGCKKRCRDYRIRFEF